MTKDDLREVVERLQALESLTQLFNNLWFDKIRGDIKDEKVKAYLTVFEDALPGLDKVIHYMVQNAEHLSEDQTYEVREGFDLLSQALLNRETQMDLMLEDDLDPDIFDEEGLEEDGDMQADSPPSPGQDTVDQGAIDDLFSGSSEGGDGKEDSQEIENFFADDNDEPPEDIGNESDEELAELPLDEGEDDSEEEEDLEDLLSDEDDSEEEEDLEDLLSEEDDAEEEEDLEDLLSEEDDADDDDIDLDDLLSDDDEEEDVGSGADISEDEMTALLEEEDDEEPPPPKKKAVPKAKAKVKKAKPKDKPEEDGESLSQVSQDEIDALFG